MSTWEKIDKANWPRREHFEYYTKVLKIQYNMTANIKVEKLLDYCQQNGKKFYATLIYLVSKTVNSIDNFKMFQDKEGNLCVWDYVVPNYTIFHNDDKTFSDCWSEYDSDFEVFYQAITCDMEKYKDVKGIKARQDQPANFYCVSAAPWTAFTSFNSRIVGGGLQFFPVITMGKYERAGEHVLMPVNLNVIHAVCDGYHAGLFFDTLQREIDALTVDERI